MRWLFSSYGMLALASGCASVFCALGCASTMAPAPAPLPTHENLPTQIISQNAAGSAKELYARGEALLAQQKFREAADQFTTLLASNEKDAEPYLPQATFDLGVAREGFDARAEARASYEDVVKKFSASSFAKPALLRMLTIDAYLEDWPALLDTANALLTRTDADDVDKMTALGARGLAEIEQGDDVKAGRDVEAGLEIVDRLHYGEGGRLPAPAAQLRFAQGEVRRVRSEKIQFVPADVPEAMAVQADFLAKMNARCEGLMDAQHAYGDAMRSVDAHWIAMSGFRVGEMYRKLHHDLMTIPPTLLAKSDKQKQIFFAIMHVRYRVLLEKGRDMMDRTISVADAGLDSSDWIARARQLRADIDLAIEEEKATIASFPFSEDEVKKAIEILRDKAEKEAEKKLKK
ncbi:MAG: tetratricopeptide repeat protein [Polyangiaceae bacterium]